MNFKFAGFTGTASANSPNTSFSPGSPAPSGYHGSTVLFNFAYVQGTYTPSVTATSGTLTHTITLPMITFTAPPDTTTGVAVI